MGQKVNPHGFRVGIIKDWDSHWVKNKRTFGNTLVEDYNIRKCIIKTFNKRPKNSADKCVYAGISKIEIERFSDNKVRIQIYCARPGIVIGRQGSEIEKFRIRLEKMIRGTKQVYINIIEIQQPDINSKLVAEKIAHDLEDRVSFRRAMKQAISKTMRLNVKGIKIKVSGRLSGAEIARSESYHEGTIPLQTIRADIDYGLAEANTTYGKLGVKVWIYKGEIFKSNFISTNVKKEDKKNNRTNRRHGGSRRGKIINREAKKSREGGNYHATSKES